MSAPLMIGREATHGTLAASVSSAPVNFTTKLVKANLIPEEQRGGQDVHFAMLAGQTHQEWAIADSMVYHDNIGFFLCSAFGLPVSTLAETGVYDSVFKFADDPPSLTYQWMQPRRAVQAYQSLWSVADKLSLSFDAGGTLKFTMSGVGMPETETSNPTYAFTTTRPLTAWQGTVTLLGGAFTRLVKGTINITRNRKPFRTINNTAAPIDFSIGNRMVEFDLQVDFNGKTVYDDFKSSTPTDALTVVWEDTVLIGATMFPRLTAKLGTLGWETAEVDTGEDFPQLKLTGKGIYNVSDASKAVFTVRSTKQYQTVVS